MKKLKEYFVSLDTNKNGSIGQSELEEPLIGLGFASSKSQIEAMIRDVDDDGSGQIEFPEFLKIIRNSGNQGEASQLSGFFKDFISGKLGSNDMSFLSFVRQ